MLKASPPCGRVTGRRRATVLRPASALTHPMDRASRCSSVSSWRARSTSVPTGAGTGSCGKSNSHRNTAPGSSQASRLLGLDNCSDKGEHPFKCLLAGRDVEVELIFVGKRRAVIGREEKAVDLDAELFKPSRQGNCL